MCLDFISIVSSEKERLVHNALLNYLSRALQTNKTDEICEKAVGFYDKDTIIKAKDSLLNYSNTSSRNVARLKIATKVLDMLKLIQLCETNRIKLVKFVIFDPTEVPTTPGELSAIVTQKVAEISNNLKDVIESEKKSLACTGVAIRWVIKKYKESYMDKTSKDSESEPVNEAQNYNVPTSKEPFPLQQEIKIDADTLSDENKDNSESEAKERSDRRPNPKFRSLLAPNWLNWITEVIRRAIQKIVKLFFAEACNAFLVEIFWQYRSRQDNLKKAG
ncbi:hypothetical protein QYM36_017888 [Artemia franciscana]|uniref:Uncharacterized protein n=1 Tax=Artemia franciscana TaxID=6661 RepID=A0AA88H397_ARTSF|nr:hypothetical protein QYM36_017850 [Artemia franciscana]KAK2703756.1 hypothetical protein QYM36_017888 [Artemia franciscana]